MAREGGEEKGAAAAQKRGGEEGTVLTCWVGSDMVTSLPVRTHLKAHELVSSGVVIT